MDLENMKLKDLANIASLFSSEPKQQSEACDLGINIVVLQRGWTVVGHLYKQGTHYLLKNGSVIRKWGTTEGLGQLAKEGKRDETKLDPLTLSSFHELTTILIIKCEESKWL